MKPAASKIALPGQLLVEAREAQAHEVGIGAYKTSQGDVRSCQAGVVIEENIQSATGRASIRWSVVPPSVTTGNLQTVLCDAALKVGDVVLSRVTHIMSNQVSCDIIAVDDMQLRTSARGVIRREDVRQTETDQASLLECFRPGDIVRAAIVSLGDSRQYFLSTADQDGGVRFAMSIDGNVMQPVSWQQMRDPVSGLLEPRKVAVP